MEEMPLEGESTTHMVEIFEEPSGHFNMLHETKIGTRTRRQELQAIKIKGDGG